MGERRLNYTRLFDGSPHRINGLEPGEETQTVSKRIREAARYRRLSNVIVRVRRTENGSRYLFVQNLSLDGRSTGTKASENGTEADSER